MSGPLGDIGCLSAIRALNLVFFMLPAAHQFGDGYRLTIRASPQPASRKTGDLYRIEHGFVQYGLHILIQH